MATRRFSASPGDEMFEVTEAVGAAVVTKPCEFTVDLGATVIGGTRQITRDEALQQLMLIHGYIMTRPWPPA